MIRPPEAFPNLELSDIGPNLHIRVSGAVDHVAVMQLANDYVDYFEIGLPLAMELAADHYGATITFGDMASPDVPEV